MLRIARSRPVIGYLVNNVLSDLYMQTLWHGVVEEAEAAGVDLICFSGKNPDRPSFAAQNVTVLSQIEQKNVDALITVNIPKEQLRDRVPAFGSVPSVSIQAAFKPGILAENYAGMREAIAHLITVHGRRNLAFVKGNDGDFAADERYRAYVDELADNGLEADPRLVFQGHFERRGGAAAIRAFVEERRVPFDGVATANDGMAFGVLEELAARDIAVPGAVSVVGFDDEQAAVFSSPPLTTVKQPLQAMASRAVQMVLAQLRGERLDDTEVMPTQLVVRRSCGCFSESVVRAGSPVGAGVGSLVSGATRNPLKSNRGRIAANVLASMAGRFEVIGDGWAERLATAVGNDLGCGECDEFLAAIEHILEELNAKGIPAAALQDGLSSLDREVCRTLAARPAQLIQAQTLFHQARVLIGETGRRQLQSQQADETARQATIRSIIRALGTTFNVAGIADLLATELPRMGVSSCYLALYEGHSHPIASSRLVLAYRDSKRLPLEAKGRIVPTAGIIPADLHPSTSRSAIMVMPIFFDVNKNEQLGYVVFDIGTRDGATYEALSDELGTALKGARLFEERDRLLAEVTGAVRQVNEASGQMAGVAEQAGLSTTQVTATIGQVARGATDQAASLANASDAIFRISRSIEQSVEAAESSSRMAEHAATVAEQGAVTVNESIQRMNALKGQVDLAAQKVEEMGRRSGQIATILETIDDIAAQTNLLALNATVEAAHAGEQGRGFAVVASEVSRLAERSDASAKEIDGLIRDIQRTVKEAVTAMQSGTREVENGVALTRQSGAALAAILEAMRTVNAQLAALKDVESNLTAMAVQVTDALNNTAAVSEQNSAAAEEVSAVAEGMQAQVKSVSVAAQRLAEMAEAMSGLVAESVPGSK
jgi:methyl-accepting chemotaxis protein/DNA-binding LacI/PurR family transcriptional regulator